MDDDQLVWFPSSSTQRRPIQLPLNLRNSSSASMPPPTRSSSMFSCRSSRISNIFSSEVTKEEDDPFELHKLNNNKSNSKSSPVPISSSNQVGLLVDIGTDSPKPPTPPSPPKFMTSRPSDIGSKLQSALDDGVFDDSLLSLKLNGSGLVEDSPDRASPNLNNAFTDWEKLQSEASAIVSDIKMPKTPLTGKISLASFSPANSPQLIPLDDSGSDLQLVANDDGDTASPVILPAKLLSFTHDSSGAIAKKKLPFAEVQQQSRGLSSSSGANSPRPKSSKTESVSSCGMTGKENSSPLISFDSPNEVFIDDQLERAIKASKMRQSANGFSAGSGSSRLLSGSSSQGGNSRFGSIVSTTAGSKTSSRLSSLTGRSTLSSTAASVSDTSLRDKSLISSTPVVPKARRSFYGAKPGGLCTPLKVATPSGPSRGITTPRGSTMPTMAKPSPIRPSFARPGLVSSVTKPTKSRYSLATPMMPTPRAMPSPRTSQISTTPMRSCTTPLTTSTRSSRYSLAPSTASSSKNLIDGKTAESSSRIPASPRATSKSMAARSLYSALSSSTTAEAKLSSTINTPQIVRPMLSKPHTTSKLSALKQSSVLRSKMTDVRTISTPSVSSSALTTAEERPTTTKSFMRTPSKIPASRFK